METITKNEANSGKNSQSWLKNVEHGFNEMRTEAIKKNGGKSTIIGNKVIISGVECVEEKTVDKTGLAKKLVIQIENEKKVEEKLKKMNLTYEAKLPTDFFQNLVAGGNFYTFKKLNSEGKTLFNFRSILDLERLDFLIKLFIIAPATALVLNICVWFCVYINAIPKEEIKFLIMMSFYIPFIFSIVIRRREGTTEGVIFGIKNLYFRFFNEKLKRIMWPKKTDIGIDEFAPQKKD